MQLSRIARAINTLCLELAPSPGEGPPGPPPGEVTFYGFDECAQITPEQWNLLEDQRRLVHDFCGVGFDWGRELKGEFVLPPEWSGPLQAYKDTLLKGELGCMLEIRWVENAGLATRLLLPKDYLTPL
jgi:hypothetical protein